MEDKSGEYFIDTNVLVCAHDMRDARKQSKAQEVIFDGLRMGTAVISTQVLSEFFVIITQKIEKPLSVAKAKKEVIVQLLEVIMSLRAPLENFNNVKRVFLTGRGASATKQSLKDCLPAIDVLTAYLYNTIKRRQG